jgi:hypothetical protein
MAQKAMLSSLFNEGFENGKKRLHDPFEIPIYIIARRMLGSYLLIRISWVL